MQKAFSLFELIIVIVIISFISVYFIQKSEDSFEFTNKAKIKSDIALIRSSISKIKASNTLLNKEHLETLDDEELEKVNSELFKNILDFPLFSTSSIEKEEGKWIKISSTKYKIFISKTLSLEYEFQDFSFICKSELSLCKDFE